MLRLKSAFALLALVPAALLSLLIAFAAPFSLGDSLDGGGPGSIGRGSVWFTDFNVPACGLSLSGDVMSDAVLDPDDETAVGTQFNAFDSGLQLVVDGAAFNDSDDSGNVASDAGGQAATIGPEPMAGLQVAIEWKALTSSATLRTFATLQNSTGADITVPISWETNLGSDTGTTVVGSGSGDTTFSNDDRWLVTSDEAAPVSDPINTSVLFGPGTPDVTPTSVGDLFTGCGGEEGVVAGYDVTVPAGQTRHLLFFNQMNQTNAEALTAASGFDTNPAPESEFLSGIGLQLLDILNWDFQELGPSPTPAPPETPTPTPAASATATASPSPSVLTPTPSPVVRAALLPPTGDGSLAGTGHLALGLVIAGATTLSIGALFILAFARRRAQQ
jgi:hypothetical protein